MTALAPQRSRRSLGASIASMYSLTLRQHVHGKRWIILALLFLLPPGLAVLIRSTARHVFTVEVEFTLAFMFIPQAVLPLVALVYASGITQDEQEDQTFTYLLIRPIPKSAIYLAKLLAAATTCVVLVWIFTALTYACIFAGRTDNPPDLWHRYFLAAAFHSLAVVTYCSIFGLLGLLSKRPLVVGILYTAIVEGLFGNLPFGIRLVTVIYYARLITFRSMDFIRTIGPRSENLAADAWNFDINNDPNLMEHPSLRTAYCVLIFGSIACALLGAFLCSRREFYVKTPEKGGN